MNYLAIDTSGSHLTVIINYENKLYSYFNKLCGVDHSTLLMVTIDKMVSDNNVDLSKMDFFAVVLGAGSFTGVRIGVSTIKAMCLAYDKKCLGVTSFDVLSYNYHSEKVLAVIDAKHDNFYVEGFNNGKTDLLPTFINLEKLKELSKDYKVLSSKQIQVESEIIDLEKGLNGAVLAHYKQATNDINFLTPLYIRKSQAEENR